jgi:hypothetical protein
MHVWREAIRRSQYLFQFLDSPMNLSMSRAIWIRLAYLALEDVEFRMPVRKREQ